MRFTDLVTNAPNSGRIDNVEVPSISIIDNQSGGQSQADVHAVAVRVAVGEASPGEKLYPVGRYTMDYIRLIPAFIYVAIKPTDSRLEPP